MERTLASRRVAVVGGSSGMGRAIVRRLVLERAQVVAGARGAAALADVARENEGRVTVESVDFTDDAALARFFSAHAPLDHVVVTAAGAALGRLLDLPVAEARGFLEGKLWGQYLSARAAGGVLRPGGSLTLFSGAASRRVQTGFALGGAINAAIEALASALALELAPIRVNCVAPGLIDTPVWERLLPDPERRSEALEATRRLPAGRPGRPEEVADAVLFLIRNDYVTGHTLVVDGGFVHA